MVILCVELGWVCQSVDWIDWVKENGPTSPPRPTLSRSRLFHAQLRRYGVTLPASAPKLYCLLAEAKECENSSTAVT